MILQNPKIDSDSFLSRWLINKTAATRKYYLRRATEFIEFVNKPLEKVCEQDVQAFFDYLKFKELQPSSQYTILAVVKSLLSFGYEQGFLSSNASKNFKLFNIAEAVTRRDLSEEDVHLMIELEPNYRNQVILQMFYFCGLRSSELCWLKWKHLSEHDGIVRATVLGKGAKIRSVLVPTRLWQSLLVLKSSTLSTDPLFLSRKSGHLHPSQVFRIVQSAAKRAGLDKKVSPVWLRHAHASHALDNGAPLHLVRDSMGHENISATNRYLHARCDDHTTRYLNL